MPALFLNDDPKIVAVKYTLLCYNQRKKEDKL